MLLKHCLYEKKNKPENKLWSSVSLGPDCLVPSYGILCLSLVPKCLKYVILD